jgi:hypothetical protein
MLKVLQVQQAHLSRGRAINRNQLVMDNKALMIMNLRAKVNIKLVSNESNSGELGYGN